jgi:alpha-tubulin suppressor-like RCC1 family protein
VYGTGDNTSGQVGIGNSKKYVLDPQRLSQLSDVSIIQAAKFSACICNGQLYVWGGSTKQFTPF